MNVKLIMMMETLRSFIKREDGASAIEYALIAGLMAAMVIGAFGLFGDGLTDIFTAIKAKLSETAGEVHKAEGGGS